MEYLHLAIEKSVIPTDWYNKTRKLNEDLEFYQSEYNLLKRHKQLLKESIEEKDSVAGVLIALGVMAYSTGPYPLSHHGLGEIAVICFFGMRKPSETRRRV